MTDREQFEAWAITYHSVSNPGPLTKIERGGQLGYFYGPVNASWAAWQAAQALEREACAKVCEELRLVNSFAPAQAAGFHSATTACAAAIRARGKEDSARAWLIEYDGPGADPSSE